MVSAKYTARRYAVFLGDNCIDFCVLFSRNQPLGTHTPGKCHCRLIGYQSSVVITHCLCPFCDIANSSRVSRTDDERCHSIQTVSHNAGKCSCNMLFAAHFRDAHSTMPFGRYQSRTSFVACEVFALGAFHSFDTNHSTRQNCSFAPDA